jgi:DNA-binding transcriptional MerR regulator
MPYRDRPIEKLYWSIGEVALDLGVNTSVIRYWERELGTLKPKRNGKGDRTYTKQDIAQLREVHRLLRQRGYTMQGAKEHIRKGGIETNGHLAVRDRLLRVREGLMALRATLVGAASGEPVEA